MAVFERQLVRQQAIHVSAARRVGVDFDALVDDREASPLCCRGVQGEVGLRVLLGSELRPAGEQTQLLGLMRWSHGTEGDVELVVPPVEEGREQGEGRG